MASVKEQFVPYGVGGISMQSVDKYRSTLHVLCRLTHSCHMRLLQGECQPPEFFFTIRLTVPGSLTLDPVPYF